MTCSDRHVLLQFCQVILLILEPTCFTRRGGTSCGAGPGDPGEGRYLEAPEPMAEVVSSAFSHESMASMLASKGKKCWNGFEDVLGKHVGI